MITRASLLRPKHRIDPDRSRAEWVRRLLRDRLLRDADGRIIVRVDYEEAERRLKEREK